MKDNISSKMEAHFVTFNVIWRRFKMPTHALSPPVVCLQLTGDSSEADDRQHLRRSRRRRKSRKESSTEQNNPCGPNNAQSIYPLAQVKYLPITAKHAFDMKLRILFSRPDDCKHSELISLLLCLSVLMFQENSGFLLNALLKRGLSDEQPMPDSKLAATAAPDTLKLDAMTPEPEALDTVAANFPLLNPAQPGSVASGPEVFSRSSGPGSGSGDSLEEEIRSKLSRLVSQGNSKDSSSSDEEGTRSTQDKQKDKAIEKHKEKSIPKETERQRQRASVKRDKEREVMEQVNGQQMKRVPGLVKSASVREEARVQERRLERRAESFVENVAEKEQKRGEGNRVSKKQRKRDGEKEAAQKGGAKRSGSSASSPAASPSSQEGGLSNNQVR